MPAPALGCRGGKRPSASLLRHLWTPVWRSGRPVHMPRPKTPPRWLGAIARRRQQPGAAAPLRRGVSHVRHTSAGHSERPNWRTGISILTPAASAYATTRNAKESAPTWCANAGATRGPALTSSFGPLRSSPLSAGGRKGIASLSAGTRRGIAQWRTPRWWRPRGTAGEFPPCVGARGTIFLAHGG